MPRRPSRWSTGSVLIAAALAGFLVAAFAAIAGGKSFTLRVAKNVHVDNTALAAGGIPVTKRVNVHENVAVGASGFAVYTFQGETTHHLICKKTSNAMTNCWGFWPPVTVNSAKGLSAQKGIKGKLGTFRNHGLRQVTLGGKPLYYFTPDISSKNKKQASGDALKTFGSVWHIVKAAGSSTTQGTNSTSTSTTTSSTSSCAYPPYC
jgi:predicted lipoprotein with Yx(FWY)xxD motif